MFYYSIIIDSKVVKDVLCHNTGWAKWSNVVPLKVFTLKTLKGPSPAPLILKVLFALISLYIIR